MQMREKVSAGGKEFCVLYYMLLFIIINLLTNLQQTIFKLSWNIYNREKAYKWKNNYWTEWNKIESKGRILAIFVKKLSAADESEIASPWRNLFNSLREIQC